MSDGFRVRILCEDRRSERFLRRLCERYRVEILRGGVEIAPEGKGSASTWVMKRYPKMVRLHRSKRHQVNLGLLVHVDGDNQGVQARKTALDAELTQLTLSARSPDETVAIFVPTWCIETWLLHLSGAAQPPEHEQIESSQKNYVKENESEFLRKAIAAWPSQTLSSLADAAIEASRIGIPRPPWGSG